MEKETHKYILMITDQNMPKNSFKYCHIHINIYAHAKIYTHKRTHKYTHTNMHTHKKTYTYTQ